MFVSLGFGERSCNLVHLRCKWANIAGAGHASAHRRRHPTAGSRLGLPIIISVSASTLLLAVAEPIELYEHKSGTVIFAWSGA
jgi:hypothetical protein